MCAVRLAGLWWSAPALLLACTPESLDPVRVEAQYFANSEWSEPVHLPAPVNSPARELAATLSPDGLSIYFGSDRAGTYGGVDIWVAHRECPECDWGTPVNLGPDFNSAGGDGNPALSPDGHLLFFVSSRAGGYGAADIWVARRSDLNDDLAWGPPVNLGPNVNTAVHEGGPSYVPAGGTANFYFARAGDIYQARVERDGEAVAPAVPVAELNTAESESKPSVRGDAREIVFWAVNRPDGTGAADIWVATRQSPVDPWSAPQPLGGGLNTPYADLEAVLSFDGRTLLISYGPAARPSLGNQDIWMSTRTPSTR
jgi:Tol biopolymer transport system component